jgi:predicted amidophosphoribosyltransferase
MAISLCELCGKPFNSISSKLCSECSRIIDETYIKVRKYIYQNPKNCEFIDIIEATEVSEKELNYLIKKGRIEVVNKIGGGPHCRACGKKTTGSALCEQCMAKIVSEKLTSKEAADTDNKESEIPGRKRIIPKSYND